MENPANWPEATKLISFVVDQYYKTMQSEPELCGLSLEMQIYNALVEAGHMIGEINEGPGPKPPRLSDER